MGKRQRERRARIEDRVRGGLLGVAAGDCLGAGVEFKSRASVRSEYPGGVREITGGGAFGWRAGQGTDDTDLTAAVLRGYLRPDGYSLNAVADNFAAWKSRGPRDIGGTTAGGISNYLRTGDPTSSGETRDSSAANGSLMRCIPTGLMEKDDARRAEQAAAISAITHAEPRCLDSCVAYCDMVHRMVEGDSPQDAINWVLEHRDLDPRVEEVLITAPHLQLDDLDGSGYVLGSLGVAVWAVTRDPEQNVEDVLAQTMSLGQDTDTHGAIAGGLLGASRGASALPDRWIDVLEYADMFEDAVPDMMEIRGESVDERGLFARIFGRRNPPETPLSVLGPTASKSGPLYCGAPTKAWDGSLTGPPCQKKVTVGATTCGEAGHQIPRSRWAGAISSRQPADVYRDSPTLPIDDLS